MILQKFLNPLHVRAFSMLLAIPLLQASGQNLEWFHHTGMIDYHAEAIQMYLHALRLRL